MAKVVGDISVQVGADVSNLQAGMRRAGRSVDGFDKRSKKMAANFAKVGAAVAVAAAAAAAGLARMASNAAATAKDIQNLSNIAGVGVESFQRYSQAAKTVGIEQDKLSDIFKDVNDKFGDFLETGAGPLVDFFEQIAPQVGVTAEQFARLSGPEALQLYVSSLEKAGASQQQMTFYLEALASDATALLPLLKDNGEGFKTLGDEAERAGRILSEDAVRGGAELDKKLSDLSDTLRTTLNEAILENSEEIIALVETITQDWIPALKSVIGFIADVVSAIANMVSEIGSAMGAIIDFGATVGDLQNGAPEFFDSDSQAGRLRASGRRPIWAGLETGYAEAAGDQSTPSIPTTGDAIQAQEEAREAALERLIEFRNRQEEIESEADDKRIAGRQKTEDDLAEVERRAQQARQNAMRGALGDVASLMQSENKKLFKIGQAAAIADATVNGYSAAVAAWDKGMKAGGPPLAAAFTAASLARTGALISSIASANSSGGGGSTAAAAGGASPVAQDAAPRSYYNISLTGGDQYGGDQIRGLISKINEEIEDGAVLGGVRVV